EVGAAAPATPVGARRVLERPAQQAQVLVGYLGPGLSDPAYPAVRVLGAVLGGGMAGRLFVELREKRGLAYALGVLIPFRTGTSFFVTHLGTAPENSAAAEAGLLAALDRRTNARQAWYLAFFEVIGAGWDFPERYAQALDAVTAADVEAAAQRFLIHPTIVVLLPPAR